MAEHMLLVLLFYFLCQMNVEWQNRLKYGGPLPYLLIYKTWLQTPWLVLCIEFYSDLNKTKNERLMLWQCCYLTVCRVSIQHTRRCGSIQPSVSCSGDGLPVPEGITQLMNGSRAQWMGGYQSPLPETSTVH